MQKPIKKATLILWIIGGVMLIGSLISIGNNAESAAVGLVAAFVLGLIGFIVGRKKAEETSEIPKKEKKGNRKERTVIKEMEFSVWGTTYTNENGTSRQTYIAKLKAGDDLAIHPAPTAEYPDTIGVFTTEGNQIGFINYKVLNELRGLYLHNDASIAVKEVTHSERGLGVDVIMKIYE